MTDSDIVRTKIISTDEVLKDAVIAAESIFILGGGGSLARDIYLFFANDDDAAAGLAGGLAGVLASFLETSSDLVGNTLFALPLRPVPVLQASQVNQQFFAQFATLLQQHQLASVQGLAGLLLNLANQNPFPAQLQFAARELLLFQLLAGELNGGIRMSATGEQHLANVLPINSVADTAIAFHAIFVRTLDNWLNVNPQQIVDLDFFTHLLQNVVTRKFQEQMFDQIELAHIVNRTVRYTHANVRNEDENEELFLDWNELNQGIAPHPQGVPCMRYMVSLDRILLTEILTGFLTEDPNLNQYEQENGIKKLQNRHLSVEWEVYSFHEAFEDSLNSDDWVRDENGLLPGARLLKKAKNDLTLKAMNNGLDGQFSKNLFLEWNTNDDPEMSNCRLLITGKVQLANLNLGRFNIEIPMHQAIGLYTPESRVLEAGEVDLITSFKAEGLSGQVGKQAHAYTIFASLTQQPFASAYQSVSVAAMNYVLLLPRDMERLQKPIIASGTPFFMEGKINGRTFQTSRIQFVSNVQNHQTVSRGETNDFGSGWTTDIVYPQENIGEGFQLEIIAHVLDPNDLSRTLLSIPAVKTIHRFSTDDQDQIIAAGSELETSIQEAVDSGAALEWGIPVGLPFAEFVLTSERSEFTAKIRITNKSFVPSKVPAIDRAKDMRVDFIGADVGENGDSFGAEIRFFPKVLVNHEDEVFSQTYDLGSTRRFNLSDNEPVDFPGPPSQGIKVKPEISELNITCFGKEYDNPRWFDPHDSLGTARITEMIPIDDSIDGSHTDNSNGPDGDFTLKAEITTTSPPPPPRFRFQGFPSGLNYMMSISGAAVTFEYEVAWADELILQFRDGTTNNQFVEAAVQPNGLSGSLVVNPAQDTTYRIIATNVVTESQPAPASEEMFVQI